MPFSPNVNYLMMSWLKHTSRVNVKMIGTKVAFFFSVLWWRALHVCELMFSLSLFRGLSSHLPPFSFLQRQHGGALLLILFYSVPLFSTFLHFPFFCAFVLSFCFSSLSVVYQDGFYGAAELYVSMKLPVSCLHFLSLSFSLSECFTACKL